jgi:hypothetical protein
VHEALFLCPGSLPVVGTACSTLSNAARGAAGSGVDAVFAAAGRWVASGAVWLIAEVGKVVSSTTSIDLSAGWFSAHQAVMASLAAAVVVPMACCAAIQAIYRQSASMLLRTFLVNLPLALLLTGVAVALVRVGLAVTDAMSARVLSSAGVDTRNLFSGLTTFFAGAGASGPAVPAFVVFIGGLLVSMAALVLWLELVVRAAAVSVAVLFLPLALAALVWPAVAHWCRRLADTLVALVLSKFVIAAVLSLAAGAVAGGLGLSGSGNDGGFSAVVTGIALLVIATLSPFTLLRLVPAVEAGAVAHLESARHRLQSAAKAPVRTGGNLALDLAGGGGAASALRGGEVLSVGAGGSGGAAASGRAGASSGVGASGGGADGGTSAIPMIAGTALASGSAPVADGAAQPAGGRQAGVEGSTRAGGAVDAATPPPARENGDRDGERGTSGSNAPALAGGAGFDPPRGTGRAGE